MKMWKATILAVLAALGLNAPVAHASDIANALTAEYTRYVKAFIVKDTAPIERQMLPSWKGKKNGHLYSRQQILSLTRDAMKSTSTVNNLCFKIGKWTKKGNEVVALVNAQSDLTLVGDDGDEHRLVTNENLRDTWVKTAAGWRLKRSETLNSRSTLDGKAYDPDL